MKHFVELAAQLTGAVLLQESIALLRTTVSSQARGFSPLNPSKKRMRARWPPA